MGSVAPCGPDGLWAKCGRFVHGSVRHFGCVGPDDFHGFVSLGA